MYKIVFTKKVENDFKLINNFIAQDNPIHAIKTINSIIKTMDLLLNFPFVWKSIWDNLREILETNYKYKIVYKIDNKIIIILSVYKYQNTWK